MNDVRKKRKKKIAIHIVIVIILCVPMAFLWYAVINADKTSYETEFVTETEPCVYVTDYGKRYHSAGCSYLTKSQHAMGKQEAIRKGYTACSRCGGKSSGSIAVTYTKKIAVKGKPKSIREPIFLSVLLTPTIYFLIYLLLTKQLKTKQYKKTTDCPSSESFSSLSSPNPRQPQPKIRVGDAVYHKTFGLGVIKEINGKTFTVRFDHEAKDFIHPDIFDSGLMKKI